MRTRIALSVLCIYAVTTPAQAQTTWHVDDNNCPGSGSGSQEDPFCKIQDGINATTDGDEVVVAMGTYHEVISFNGKAIMLRSSDGPEATTIDGSGFNKSVVRCHVQTKAEVLLDGFTIMGGFSPSGGGVVTTNCQLVVSNCIFRGNTATIGGAIRISGIYDPAITDCIFVENVAIDGGGIWILKSSPTITNCIFVRNDAVQGGTNGGGGIFAQESNVVITDCIFTQNRTQRQGGGIMNYLGTIGISECSFLRNYAQLNGGGGIFNFLSPETVVSNSFFCGNSNGDIVSGGGYTDGGGNEFLEECRITGACCVKGVCAVLTPDLCASVKGVYQGDDAACDEATCSQECPADLDHNGEVGAFDLALLLGSWGPCP